MDKITALYTLGNGFIQITPCITLLKNSGVPDAYTLTICNIPGMIQGGRVTITADTPEALKNAILTEIRQTYNNSLTSLLTDITENL